MASGGDPVTLDAADVFGDAIYEGMPDCDWHFTGSYRRRSHLRGKARQGVMIGDHDIVVVRRSGLLTGFPFPPAFQPELANGRRLARGYVYLHTGRMRADFYAARPRNVGGFLLYGTGPQNLSIHMRSAAQTHRWKLNQKGLFDETGRQLDNGTEEHIFELLGVPYLTPAQRDAWGGPDLTAARITIKSRSGGKPHEILLDDQGRASCSCPHFVFRRTDCWAITKAKTERKVAA